MKEFAIQKQFIPVDSNTSDPSWAARQVWVYKINALDEVNDFDTLAEAQSKQAELSAADPSGRVYRVVHEVSGSYLPVD